MRKQPALLSPQSQISIPPKNLTITSKQLFFKLNGVSSNGWNYEYHESYARYTQPDLMYDFNIDIIKFSSEKSLTSKLYWPHTLRNKLAAIELAYLVERDKEFNELAPIMVIEHLT